MIKVTDEMLQTLLAYRSKHGTMTDNELCVRLIELHEQSKPKPEPLSDVDIEVIGYKYGFGVLEDSLEFTWYNDETIDFARAIEQAHEIH